MDIGGLGNAYLENAINQNKTDRQQTAATDAKKAADGLSAESNRAEMTEAAKSFEAYFVEQLLKEVKDSVNLFGDDADMTTTMTSDYYLDATISTLAKELVDQYGDSFTEDMVDQMMRNYGVPAEEVSPEE
ncbi:MAG: hypothetical protein K6B14_06210 [Lachnospiraceae bacterium]|nr:hypothetical protein [Lachnospiraceae bacterium]